MHSNPIDESELYDEGQIRKLLESGEAKEIKPFAEEISRWLEASVPKGDWTSMLATAEMFHVSVDENHKKVEKLLPYTVGGDSRVEVEAYLFRCHGIIPGDSVSVEEFATLLRGDVERAAAVRPRGKRGRPSNKAVHERNCAIRDYHKSHPGVGPTELAKALSQQRGEPITVDMIRNATKPRTPGKK